MQLVVSTGGTAEDYHPDGKNEYPAEQFLRGLNLTFKYFGAKPQSPRIFHAAWQLSAPELATIGRTLLD